MIDYNTMLITFRSLGQKALSLNHYDLSIEADGVYSADEWKEFLDNPKTREYIQKEMEIIKSSQLNKIIQEAGSSHSVGQAQLLNTLAKIKDDEKEDNGPTFIYCYVPLNEEQMNASNILKVDENGKPIITPLSD